MENPQVKQHKDAIILFSHGSLLCGAGENLRRLAAYMQQRGDAEIVEVGYLNYSEPPFEASFRRCVAAGATRITVVPYFLVAGKFVQVDLPPKIEAMRAQYPQVEVLLAQAMRFHEALADALIACAHKSASPAHWRDILNTAPQFCRADPRCPLYGEAPCPAQPKGEPQ
ncbi:MAG: CbiX/SirB N-terminal domain-containing protein [Abitibacteriaceae bacterium]|nr:CbiX/SirB N-terminal domain-containing protein [Abditibacteriaceae bacterium]